MGQSRIKISVKTDILVLEFYGYIKNIVIYFYINIGEKNNKNILKLIEIL